MNHSKNKIFTFEGNDRKMANNEARKKVIVICGPTASGKTSLSVELAKKINGQIISADSMQVYDEIIIGTARPTTEEMQGIKHYLLGNIPITKRFSVSEYKNQAQKAIKEIISNNNMPIIVGGTGLYINSLIYGIDYPEIETDQEYRKYLEKLVEHEGLNELYYKAMKIDPEAMEKISKNDKKRILRVLEIYHQTGKNKTQLEQESRKNGVEFDYKIFAINFNRDVLYERINKRVDIMINNGLIEEAKTLYEKYGEKIITGAQAIGYKEVIDYLNGIYTIEEMTEKIKMETRRYAKRQLTWFRKIENITWLDGEKTTEENIEKILDIINY